MDGNSLVVTYPSASGVPEVSTVTQVVTAGGGGGGGGGDSQLFVANQQDITNAGFVDITGLTFAVAVNKAYQFEFFVVFRSSATAMGVLFGLNGPANPTRLYGLSRKQITTPATPSTDMFSEARLAAYDTPLPASAAEPIQASDLVWHCRGVFFNGANAGTFAARFSKENVAGTASIMPGSFGKYRLLN